MLKPFESYPGSKDAAGVAERIISLMPRHTTYVELCVGGGAVYRKKLPAARSLLVDIDGEVLREWSRLFDRFDYAGDIAQLIQADARDPASWPPSLKAVLQDPETLVYVDPPYLRSTRTRSIYRHEMLTPDEHLLLLTVLRNLPCRVMISGYWSELYAELLNDWRSESFGAGTRGGRRIEHVWMNYGHGLELHDVRFLGDGFRERERIKRKRNRWQRRFLAMAPGERQVISEALAAAVEVRS